VSLQQPRSGGELRLFSINWQAFLSTCNQRGVAYDVGIAFPHWPRAAGAGSHAAPDPEHPPPWVRFLDLAPRYFGYFASKVSPGSWWGPRPNLTLNLSHLTSVISPLIKKKDTREKRTARRASEREPKVCCGGREVVGR